MDITCVTFAWEQEFEDDTGYRNAVLRDPEGNEFCLGWRPAPEGS